MNHELSTFIGGRGADGKDWANCMFVGRAEYGREGKKKRESESGGGDRNEEKEGWRDSRGKGKAREGVGC